jgi:hypothetical protein
MTTTTDAALHQAIDIARRLSPRDRAQLITVLVRELAEPTNTLQGAAPQTTEKQVEGEQLSTKAQPSTSVAEASTAASPAYSGAGGEAWDHLFRVMDEISALPRTGPLSPMEDLMQGRR